MERYYWRPDIVDQVPLDGHCVIEASAGTGKTFTIEHLVVEILLNSETRLDQILAVTFTEKAASELRARIRATIEKPLRSEMEADSQTRVPLDLEKAGRLERALFSFERAPIHTIHSFCHRTLADFALLSGMRLRVEVADARTMFHEAFRSELREHFAADEWMGPLLEEWLADDRGSDRLEALLFDANERHYLDSGASARNSVAAGELLASFDYSRLAQELPPTRAKGAVSPDLATIAEAIKRSGRDALGLRRDLDAQALGRIAALKHLPGWSPETSRFLNAVGRVQFAVPLEARIIDSFLPPVARRLDRIKRERGVIDFGDMPRWLWSALEGPQGVRLARILRERFRVGLVDEFQDTDDLQWRIFRRIFVEGGGTTRLLVVGDPKQAIYGFRDADVFTYLKAKAELLEEHAAAFVPLVENFRSTADAIDAVNLILEPNPAPAFFVDGEIRYDHPVSCGSTATVADQSPLKPISILSLPPGAKLPARRYRAMLGRKIAATLKNLFDGTLPPDGTGRTSQSAPDVFVLTRTLMESREVAGYLREVGIRYAFYKQDGLFKTREAGHILDVLRAVAEPHRRSHRLKAWSTPFFGVALRDLPGLEEVAPAHPLMARLLQWKALGDQRRFAELFSAMLHESGLAARELLLADSQRELTNYEHVFEIVLERAFSAAPDLFDLIQMLASWVDGDDLPPGESPGVQRLESERDAVQIMTVHKAKGLQADIVVLFGGYANAPPQRDRVSVFHSNGGRRVIAGQSARNAAKHQLANEESAENERLLYVALTRARKKLYLAMFPPGATLRKLDGYYHKLNERLNALAAGEGEPRGRFEKLVEIVPLRAGGARPAQEELAQANRVDFPALRESLLGDDQDHQLARSLREIVARHRALSIDSYTSLQRRATLAYQADPSIFKYDVDPAATELPLRDDLAGGRAVGIFLHEVIEQLDLRALAHAPDLETWMATIEVRETIAATARRHQVSPGEAGLARGAQIVFNALRSPLALGNQLVPTLVNCEGAAREMEFTFPIPAPGHPLLGAGSGGEWTIDRGLVVGFVDFVFRFHNRIYFADWKSDLLPSYDPGTIAAHVSDHYLVQARIYTVGIVRLLRIRDRSEYQERFGGLVYVFLRGVKPDGDGRVGAYFHRPSWDEILLYERDLMTEG
jgi:exodeoxyribonuclease V beta subunit